MQREGNPLQGESFSRATRKPPSKQVALSSERCKPVHLSVPLFSKLWKPVRILLRGSTETTDSHGYCPASHSRQRALVLPTFASGSFPSSGIRRRAAEASSEMPPAEPFAIYVCAATRMAPLA
jgi:hypothetical protein